LADRENKPIFLFVHATWCDKCQRMDKKIFTSKEVMPLIMENFIAVKLNPEVDSMYLHNDDVLDRKIFLTEVEPGKYGIMVPTTVLYKGKDKEPMVLKGIMEPSVLKENIQTFLNN
jgi:thioredoxin-related protein